MPCSKGSDQGIGPQIDPACREFDFTLLFEDIFFGVVPYGLFLLFVSVRIWLLWKRPERAFVHKSRNVCKLAGLASLLVFRVLTIVFRARAPALSTADALPRGILAAIFALASVPLPYLEHRRSSRPSDVLVLAYTLLVLLSIPYVRTLWLMPTDDINKALGTITIALTAAVVWLESLGKADHVEKVSEKVAMEQTAAFWSRAFFTWLLPILRMGYSNVFRLSELPAVDRPLTGASTQPRLANAWRNSSPAHFRLLLATLKAYCRSFASAILPRLTLSAFTFCLPFLIETAVAYLNESSDSSHRYYGPSIVGAFILVYVGIAVSRAVYWHATYRMLARVRSGLTGMIYRHTVSMKGKDVQDSAALTLMGTDMERIVESLTLVHELWACLIEVFIGVWLLTRQVSYAAVLPLVVCLISIGASSLVSKRFGPAQVSWVQCVEKCVASTDHMLSDMKLAKMLGHISTSSDLIQRLRATEIAASKTFRKLIIWIVLLGNAPGEIAPFVTLATYALMALTTSQKGILASQAFAALALISLVTDPMVRFCQALPSLAQAAACFDRIQAYMLIEGEDSHATAPSGFPESSLPLKQLEMMSPNSRNEVFTFEKCQVAWSTDAQPVLHDLTLSFSTGFTAITGPVGSGKTTLLASMIGETSILAGSSSPRLSRIAFCSQTPWILNDSIRNNIICTSGREVDEEWLNTCLHLTKLQKDIRGLEKGMETAVRPNGLFLSGGQRQRLSPARAIYSRHKLVLLDDVFSGLGPTMAMEIAGLLFGSRGYFRNSGISVIMATHNNRVMYLDTGKVVGDVTAEKLTELTSQDRLKSQTWKNWSMEEHEVGSSQHTTEDTTLGNSNAQEELDTDRQRGSWSVYAYYAKSAGTWSLITWITCTVTGALASTLSTLWVNNWTTASEEESTQRAAYYLGIYFLCTVIAVAATFGECWAFFLKILHTDLLSSTMTAPYDFFLKTDTGSITNRFSQDMNLIDMTLPMQATVFTSGFVYCLVRVIVLGILGKFFALAVPVLGLALFLVQRYYLRTSRRVRLLDIEAKAPLYTHLTDSINGVAIIWAYSIEQAFSDMFGHMLDQSQKAFYLLFLIQQWLTLVLDLIVGASAVVLVALALNMSGSGGISAGSLGAALVLVIQFSSFLIGTIQSWVKLETSIGAVARVRQFVQTTPIEPVGSKARPERWPLEGAVRFENVDAAYTDDGPLVLSNLSMTIQSGERVALCGPSGSGKSSVLMSLLRMTQVRAGRILVDDEDLDKLSADEVRSSINVISQEPYFVPGSFRWSLDTRNQSSDEYIVTALRKVPLMDKIELKGGLEAGLVTSEWSTGERQLLSLARALLSPQRLVLIDEAMSNVDEHTDSAMQRIIDTEFAGRVVIAVTHRYTHIEKFDRVAVLKAGKLVEFDEPKHLLEQPGSAFHRLFHATNH
ncbi:P-loop containing nucleoside triphosphate hydrolase protein [Microdochium trichocladiopsis]|uniref:P-loop containing nucleoside triphosphate hydrolase protein n=1 Tax=Microdochium trichocladiopsis TaxID=1682393 RepID=A0A9P8Y0L9_9PEZI|nr:P-loop containing nucleoside triphosphate hydrolase protein [Microdochium trichocladiopsis]KAH7024666.1 P-loop containing nucleoside triphosphate hydrolase protein [Microdochium trichocladiopsis]